MPSFPNRRVVGACAGPHCQTSRPSGAPPKYIPSAPAIAAPPVFRPAAPTVLRKQQAPPVYNRSAAAPNRSGVPGRRTIQRYCRNPNCNDPACTDERNHGHDRVYDLRRRTLYVTDLGTDGDGVHRGTGTTQETRDAVNSRTAPVAYRLTYSGATASGETELDNPPSQSGRWDAGHIVGAQHGGLGHDPASVFPQNAQYNRGNSYHGTPTFEDWRRHENIINQEARTGGVRQTVTTFDAPRTTYFNCTACGHARASSVPCLHCGMA